MEREYALEQFQEAVKGRLEEYRDRIGEHLLKYGVYLEELVKTAMNRLGEEMRKEEKEYVCYLYLSFLKTDLIERRYRLYLHGLDIRWYLDEEPAEVYVDTEDLLEPLDQLWEELTEESRNYGGAVNKYDIQGLIFDELRVIDSTISQILRWRLRDWEEKMIFDEVVRTPYWILKWGEYRDQTEILVKADRTAKEASAWKKELKKALHKPETLIFGYWYQGTYKESCAAKLDMRFTVFEECRLKNMTFQSCNLEGSRFPKSSLENLSFENCNLKGADFTGCTLKDISFAGADLEEAIFPRDIIPFLGLEPEQFQVIRLKAPEPEPSNGRKEEKA